MPNSPPNPSGPALKPACCETAQDTLERAYARHSADAVTPWLPPAMNADAADSAAVAAEGVETVDNLASSFQTKMQKKAENSVAKRNGLP